MAWVVFLVSSIQKLRMRHASWSLLTWTKLVLWSSEIKPDGTFRVVEIGGWNPMVVSSQRFKLFTRDGREIPVISGSVPPHLTHVEQVG